MCMYSCLHVYGYVWEMYVYILACVGPRLTSGVFLNHSVHIDWDNVFQLNPKFIDWDIANLADQLFPRIPVSAF